MGSEEGFWKMEAKWTERGTVIVRAHRWLEVFDTHHILDTRKTEKSS